MGVALGAIYAVARCDGVIPGRQIWGFLYIWFSNAWVITSFSIVSCSSTDQGPKGRSQGEEEYESKQSPMSVETLAPSTSTSSPVKSPETNLFKRPADPVLLESPAIKSASWPLYLSSALAQAVPPTPSTAWTTPQSMFSKLSSLLSHWTRPGSSGGYLARWFLSKRPVREWLPCDSRFRDSILPPTATHVAGTSSYLPPRLPLQVPAPYCPTSRHTFVPQRLTLLEQSCRPFSYPYPHRLLLEEEGRPLREISSVMMTTSGFISPAREGKLPESCSPLQPSDSQSNSPQPSSYPIVPPEVKGENKVKKVLPKTNFDNLTKLYKENKKKEQTIKEMSKEENNVSSDDSKVIKLVSIKELSKLKAPTPGGLKITSKSSTSEPSRKQTKISTPSSKSIELTDPKMSKQTLNIQIKPKLDKTSQITSPLEAKPENSLTTYKFVEGKLFSEPNKHKLNIFKKISKLKEEKSEKTESLEPYVQDSQKSDTSLVIDETEVGNKQHEMHLAHINNCIESVIRKSLEFDKEDQLTFRERKSPMVKPSLLSSLIIEATSTNIDETINNVVLNHTPDSKSYVNFGEDDISKPSVSSTPELPTFSRKIDICSNFNDKKRKREKLKAKKDPMISLKSSSSNKKVKLETDVNISERLETPLVPLLSEALIPAPVFPFFSHFPPAPGLIPPPIAHPLFAKLPPLVLGKNLPHPAMPNLPLPPPLFSIQPQHKENPIEVKENIFDKPTATSTSSNSPNKATQYQVKNEEMTNAAIPPIKEKTCEKKNREHKKDKKDKDKSKKKKDKKDKLKIREKSQKKKLKTERKERDRHKLKEKKDKKDKRKDREHRCTVEEKTEFSVPKITFKLDLMASSRSPTSDSLSRKIVIRPVIKNSSKKDDEDQSQQSNIVDVPKRELSPELARISALVTRPPKQKSAKAYLKMRVDDPIQSTSFPIAWGPKPEPTPVITTASRNILDPQPGPSSSLGRGRHNRRINDATVLANALVVLSSTAEDGEIEVRISVGELGVVFPKWFSTLPPRKCGFTSSNSTFPSPNSLE
uniref:Uncharacterized protein n=1 Tax=Timema poppense TaxID=170557 RepID=A0A7R9H8K5_TIMPO|nr:unnamed protein product [Timema poppensis]